VLASGAAVASKAKHCGSDRAPLCLSQGHGDAIHGQNVGAGHWFSGVNCRYPTRSRAPAKGLGDQESLSVRGLT